ncbi:AlpA family phage regulatory protein [Acidithiobacillus ferridurans]|uniref:helix-turn-helix transcriptional regulator n=1 Tax=Acidithiobacillus ferridurans TaxID=1232575 RepID=UPI001C0798D8|nr:AlpA family phage regulatory protein [Acidithiobacillus ferridurans]
MFTEHRTIQLRPRVLRPRQAAELLGIGRTTLWRYARLPGFPCRIRLGDNAVGWLESDLLAWLESRKEG